MSFLRLALLAWLCFTASDVLAQTSPSNSPCVPCEIPCGVSERDTVFDVRLSDGRVLQNYRSVMRDLTSDFSGKQQAVRLFAWKNGQCDDTLIPATAISAVSMGGLGSKGSPLVIPLFPARELYRVSADKVPTSFIEVSAFTGYGGEDTSSREVGFASVYQGLQVLVAPFGDFLGEKTQLALGAEALFEGSRLRIPVIGHLRYTLSGEDRLVDSVKYYPSNCALQCPMGTPIQSPDVGLSELVTSGRKDSSVYLIRDRTIERSAFKPFIYAEGAYIFNPSFDGAGPDPSVNPDDYGQYHLGAGFGLPFLEYFTASLGYRYMRLNLRTPCEGCNDRFILNTNETHSVLLKVGAHF